MDKPSCGACCGDPDCPEGEWCHGEDGSKWCELFALPCDRSRSLTHVGVQRLTRQISCRVRASTIYEL